RRGAYVAVLLLVLIAGGLAAGAITLTSSRGSLATDPAALARITLPLGGGTIAGVSAVTGPHSQGVPVTVRDRTIWPAQPIPAGEQLSIDVVIRRPSWMSWLTGATQHLHLNVTAPRAELAAQYVTLGSRAPLTVRFRQPVSSVSFGTPGHLRRQTLGQPSSTVTLPRPGLAGSIWISAAVRAWETATPVLVSWFPAGATASVVASPAPGSTIGPATPLTLTFSKPIAKALGRARPPVSPVTPGGWQQIGDHTLVFHPAGAGYGLGAHVRIALPAGVSLLGGSRGSGGTVGDWRVPPGSTLRLQQLLANLGYLPLHFDQHGPPVAMTAVAQEAAAVHPPAGSFAWSYPNTPPALRALWSPGAAGELTRGAVMAFENDHGLAPDGDAGPLVWRALIAAALSGSRSSFGYTFVEVSKNAQRLTLWHSGQTVLTTAVNTGIAQAPTASGTFAVYEHLRVTTMSGTNPNGTHYHDPGIQFVSYFNGGDALHAFTRAQYGFPQSLGCVEMPLGPAGRVWPYTPIGTIVHVD
ncbi:MAG TPA: L,D-transpeptidase family protein, partial [Solirubrobacteraceae bacterium]|nr:L,D-transpeptidase family protein [Solirubrobacteraceae bacterium]